jgi:hypothetical protein
MHALATRWAMLLAPLVNCPWTLVQACAIHSGAPM